MTGTVRTLARDIYFAGRCHPAGHSVKVRSEPASGGYFYAESRYGINVYLLSLREADLVPVSANSQAPTAETLLKRTDTLFNRAYDAYVEYRMAKSSHDRDPAYMAVLSRAATRSIAFNSAWQIMSGLTPDAVEMRMQETYQARRGARIDY